MFLVCLHLPLVKKREKYGKHLFVCCVECVVIHDHYFCTTTKLCGTKVYGGGHMTEGAVFTTGDHLKDSRTNRKEKTENFGMGPTPGSVYEGRVERRSHAESR